MKKLIILAICLFTINFSLLHAQDTNWGVDFSDAIMYRYPNNINDMTGKGWEYSNSIVLYGMIKIYNYTHNPAYLDYVKKYVDSYVSASGSITFNSNANNLDHLHPGLLLNYLYRETGIEKYKKAADIIRSEFDKQPRNPSGGFWHKQIYPNQMWADGIYMAEPFLLEYGSMFNDMEYATNEATKQTTLLAAHAYDESNHLIYHGWDETKAASWADANGRSPEVWSRGMGWYCMALVDMLDILPTDHAKYQDFISLVQGLAQGIKENQDNSTGLWYQVVDKGNLSSNWIETSGSAMFIYMLKKARDKGYIDATYDDVIAKGWEGIQAKITMDNKNMPVINGFVGGMGIKDDYATYVAQSTVSAPPSSHPHGYCAILSLSSVMEWPKERIYDLNIDIVSRGNVINPYENTAYMPGEYIKLTARPQTGYQFDGWTGDVTDTDSVIYVKMDASKNITANFSSITPIKNVTSEALNVFPNPVHNKLHITTDEQVMEYQILTVGGKVVQAGTCTTASENTISVSGLPVGMYVLKSEHSQASFIKE
ncbi:glycoside hydrolase family 88 protein [Saccharicrinis sp. FJH2]|uniref:glycoside hydrolase family 88 protein n=1 Tax=Saccharicrinis sp. FJH65 TaxID=3344659 RepID=UPI0035F3D172